MRRRFADRAFDGNQNGQDWAAVDRQMSDLGLNLQELILMKIVLGSQSPQRKALLQSIVPAGRLLILPPESDNEPGFEECRSIASIESQLLKIVEIKRTDVLKQIQRRTHVDPQDCVICADTVVVVPAGEYAEQQLVLGKPPINQWQEVVRDWFSEYYSGKTHEVWTGFSVATASASREMIVKTSVTFCDVDDSWMEWYLSTKEPIGKAGGYGIQEHAAVFVNSILGSLSSVVGLPVFEVGQALRQLGCL